MGKLVLLLPDGTSLDIPLDSERITIGRRPDNHVCLPYPAVSGEHAAIVTILDDSFLEDLNSTNGTLVNEKPIAKHFLRDGDVIDIGRQKLVYHSDLAIQLVEAIAPRKSEQPDHPKQPTSNPRTRSASPPAHKPPTPPVADASTERLIPRAFGQGGRPLAARPKRDSAHPQAAPRAMHGPAIEPEPPREVPETAVPRPELGHQQNRATDASIDEGPPESTLSPNPFAISQAARLVPGEPAPERHSLQLGRPLTLGAGLVVSTDVMTTQEIGAREPPLFADEGRRRPASPSVRIQNGANAGRIVAMTRDELVIGRVGEAVAAIGRNDAGFRLLQLEGPGSVKVNERQVTAGGVALHSGDTLELAEVRLVFSAGGEADQ